MPLLLFGTSQVAASTCNLIQTIGKISILPEAFEAHSNRHIRKIPRRLWFGVEEGFKQLKYEGGERCLEIVDTIWEGKVMNHHILNREALADFYNKWEQDDKAFLKRFVTRQEGNKRISVLVFWDRIELQDLQAEVRSGEIELTMMLYDLENNVNSLVILPIGSDIEAAVMQETVAKSIFNKIQKISDIVAQSSEFGE